MSSLNVQCHIWSLRLRTFLFVMTKSRCVCFLLEWYSLSNRNPKHRVTQQQWIHRQDGFLCLLQIQYLERRVSHSQPATGEGRQEIREGGATLWWAHIHASAALPPSSCTIDKKADGYSLYYFPAFSNRTSQYWDLNSQTSRVSNTWKQYMALVLRFWIYQRF